MLRDFYERGDIVMSQVQPLEDTSLSALDLATYSLFEMPLWIERLLNLQLRIAKKIGVLPETVSEFVPPARIAFTSGDYEGIFSMKSATHDEVALGSENNAFEFRISVMRSCAAKSNFVVTALVRPYTKKARLYFKLTTPMYRFMIWRLMKSVRDGAQVL